MSSHRTRPSSEIFFNNPLKVAQGHYTPTNQHTPSDSSRFEQVNTAAEKYLADLELYQSTLEDMEAITQDKTFNEELYAVQQWFDVLTLGERTTALYALLQDSSQVQIRFFITVLQKMAQNDNTFAGVLSPTTNGSDSNGQYSQRPGAPGSPRFQAPGKSKLSYETSNSAFGVDGANGNGYRSQHKHSPSVNSSLGSAIVTPQYTSHHPSISSLASLMSPNADNFSLEQLQLPNRNSLTPWAQSDDLLNRPKSADIYSYKPPPPVNPGIKRYTSTPPPPGINISNATTQPLDPPTPTAIPVQSQSPVPSLAAATLQQQLLHPEFQGSWASAMNTPTSTMFSPISTSYGPPGAGSPASSNAAASKASAEIANATAMKLAALSTVNSRVILDGDVKKYRRKTAAPLDLDSSQENASKSSPGTSSEFRRSTDKENRNNSDHPQGLSSMGTGQIVNQQLTYSPLVDRTQLSAHYMNAFSMSLMSPVNPEHIKSGKKQPKTPSDTKSSKPKPAVPLTATPSGKESEAPPMFELQLLEDVPAWLKSLRLHKYTDNLKDLTWKQLIEMDHEDLEERGVNALGARRKMLKVFEQVKEAESMGNIMF